MKKSTIFSLMLIITVLCVSLTGCVTFRDHIDNIDDENVSSIEIYDLRESQFSESGFYENVDSVYTLDETIHSDFLDDLAKIQFSDTLILFAASDPSFYYGDWVVRINFTDGSYRFVSCGGYGETFDKDGNGIDSDHYGCDDEVWEHLIASYIPEEIFAQ